MTSPTNVVAKSPLDLERSKATFNIQAMTNAYYGSAENAARRKFIISPIEEDVTVQKYEWSREEAMAKSIDHFIKVHKSFTEKGFRPQPNDVGYMSEAATQTGSMMPGFLLYLPTVMGQASEEQIRLWYPLALRFGYVASYCQTEVTHGSAIRGIETTATFDPTTGDFILNSPTIGSTKWWNSGTGCVATHGAVFANLIIKGKNYGPHFFFVQFRDEFHKPLPGIELGDTGTKVGDNAMDTGYIRFTSVRVPRQHLMAKRQHVERDGTYVKHNEKTNSTTTNSELAELTARVAPLMTMTRARAGTVANCAGRLSIGATIVARYSCVRFQGFDTSDSMGKRENAVIDYTIQLTRVLRQIANCYAFRFTSFIMTEKMITLSEKINSGGVLEGVEEMHATSSGLKSYCTRVAADGLEDLRRCCGGHGYLLNSGVAAVAQDFVWIGTAEGDFFVLSLQLGRYLIKSYHNARAGKPLASITQVLKPLRDPGFDPLKIHQQSRSTVAAPKTIDQVLNISYLQQILSTRVLISVKEVGERIELLQKSNKLTLEQAMNKCALDLDQLSVSLCTHYIFHNFVEYIEKNSSKLDSNIKQVLTQLAQFFAIMEISRGQKFIGIVSREETILLDGAIEKLLMDLRPNVVPLVDAFDIPDSVLCSCLGRYDGNYQQALLEYARASPLNKNIPFKGYEQVLEPHLDKEFLKLRGKAHPALLGGEDSSNNNTNKQARM
jgi:acyl-CoA oxidase